MLSPRESPKSYPNFFKDLEKRFPLLVSPKLDGIRMIVKPDEITEVSIDLDVSHTIGDYVCKSREFINLPSIQVQQLFSKCYELDGEIIEGCETDKNVFNRTQSYIMSENKPSDNIMFRVFDTADEEFADIPFETRLQLAEQQVILLNDPKVTIVHHEMCHNLEELLSIEERWLSIGYEGLMIRNPEGRYKHGRGTWKEGLIYKLKRFEDIELQVLGFIEQQHNTNIDVRDNLGGAKRSTAKEGMVDAGTLGKFISMYNGELCEIALGTMKHDERQLVWNNQDKYLNKWFTCRFFPHGMKNKLRIPRYIGWRTKGF
jgi:DNA ligase-1